MIRTRVDRRLFAKLSVPATGACVAGCLLLLTLLSCLLFIVRERANRSFGEVSIYIAKGVEGRLAEIRADLEGLQSFFRASDLVEPREFDIFCAEIKKNHPFIGMAAWLPEPGVQGKDASGRMIFPATASSAAITGINPGPSARSESTPFMRIAADKESALFLMPLPAAQGTLCIAVPFGNILPAHDVKGPIRETLLLSDPRQPREPAVLVHSCADVAVPAFPFWLNREFIFHSFGQSWIFRLRFHYRLGIEDWSLFFAVFLFSFIGGTIVYHYLRMQADRAFRAQQSMRAQQMELLGTIAAGIVHDFNNVLVGIAGTVSLIKDFLEKPESAAKKSLEQPVRLLESASGRAMEIVSRLMTFAKPDSAPRQRIDMRKVLADVAALAKASVGRSVTIYIKDDGRSEPAYVLGNPVQLEQAIMNLVINGAHAMTIMRDEDEPKGGYLSLGVERYVPDRRFAERYSLPDPGGSFWRVTVADTGVGIDKKTMSRLFTPFFSTKPREAGSGLGLTSAYSIVSAHAGYIEVDSEPGQGAAFSVYLPVAAENGSAGPAPGGP